jgi:hypothetical protein
MQTYRCVSPLLDGTVQEAPPASNRDPELLIRTMSAYTRQRQDGILPLPGFNNSGVEEHNNLRYVVLRNATDEGIALYRVTNEGMLKRLKRWPDAMPEKNRKDEGIFIRLSAKEKKALQQAAASDGRPSLADWARQLFRKRLLEIGLIPEAADPSM